MTVSNYRTCNYVVFKVLTKLTICLPVCLLLSCTSDSSTDSLNRYATTQVQPQRGDWVVIGVESNPMTLNPVNFLDEAGENVAHHLYIRLLDRSATEPFDLIPQLAVSRPLISADGLQYQFDLQPMASWDDGRPVVASDVLFSLKVYLNPFVNCSNKRHYFEAVKNVKLDPNNPKRITFILKNKYFLAESALGTDLVVIDPNSYDPLNLMRDIPLEALTNQTGGLVSWEAALQQFADTFNSDDFARNPQRLTGCGPYRLVEWKDQQQVVLERKPVWWGDSLAGSLESLQAWPDRIIYRIFNDPNTAIQALKRQEIDVYSFIPPQLFRNLQSDEAFRREFELTKSPSFTYSYLGMNLKPDKNRIPFFTDVRVRRAMAHLVPVDQLIDQVLHGLARPIIGPVFPLHKGQYNDTLKPIRFDPQQAARLLNESGWVDSDGDGVRDRLFNGKRVPFRFDFLIVAGNEMRKQVALIFQQQCRSVGIDFYLVQYEFSTYVQKQLSHEFDMYYGGWAFSPAPLDLKQIFHTSNWANMGSNDVGFGTPETDALIEEIRAELDTCRSNHLYRLFQEIVYREQPYVFLMNQYAGTAIHRRFQNRQTSALRPNFQANAFWTPTEWIKYSSQKSES